MSRKKKSAAPRPGEMEQARNDLFGHIHRCGVLRATEEQQVEWMNDTIEYISECYPSLSKDELAELRGIGLRFCRPVIANGPSAEEQDGESEVSAEEFSAA
ncbi:MAG TPA: hypothetical protein VHG28_19910 [Longimicrobiaceae bacterium]|nr:hypothetical protein [Longimicrobiaceae bacterium]